VRLRPLSDYCAEERPRDATRFVLGYAHLTRPEIQRAFARLAESLRSVAI
jgi:GntR family transcriptional regulator / MocR family aminotransferase